MTDDALLDALRAIERPAQRRRACLRALQAQEFVAGKAYWAYSHYLTRCGRPSPRRDSFVRAYQSAWCESILHLVERPSSVRIDMPDDLSRTLLVCWHFPEHTSLVPLAARHDALVLVASEESWMEELHRRGCTYCFREGRVSSVLPRAFSKGRCVIAMLDHCYETSRHTIVEFLSYPARTSIGVLRLAARFGYAIRLLSIRGRTVRIVATMEAGVDVRETAVSLNRHIEAEILRRPARWLLWPAVAQRWIGVDYGESTPA